MNSKIEQGLMDTLKLKAKKGEARADRLTRILKAVTDLSDEDFDELPKEASDWANAASKALDKQAELPEFPDLETEDGDGAEEADVKIKKTNAAKPAKEAKAEKAPKAENAKVAPKPKAAKEPKAKPAKAARTAKAAKEPRGDGKVHAIFERVYKHPTESPDDVVASLKKDGTVVKIGTVKSVRSAYRTVVKFLQDKKMLTKELI